MRETELKAVVPDETACIAKLVAAGARLASKGSMADRRFDYPDRRLTRKDVVVRLRVKTNGAGTAATLDWKEPASFEGGYKHREETSITVGDATQMANLLVALGFVVTRAVDREITVLQLGDATVRFERYPRMDTLVEIEGSEEAIEFAITATGLPRHSFSADRLFQFVQRYEARTGQRAAICHAELRGEYRYPIEDA